MEIEIKELKHLAGAAKKLLEETPGKRIFAFYGAMGAGKTTFIKSLCKELGCGDTVTSPTFTIVNEYVSTLAGAVYHFDFYRIKKTTEVFDFGIDEYFDSGNYCFMEWPELIEELLPADTVKVSITVTDQETRVISFNSEN